jgi:hypothetical protein
MGEARSLPSLHPRGGGDALALGLNGAELTICGRLSSEVGWPSCPSGTMVESTRAGKSSRSEPHSTRAQMIRR